MREGFPALMVESRGRLDREEDRIGARGFDRRDRSGSGSERGARAARSHTDNGDFTVSRGGRLIIPEDRSTEACRS